MKDYTYQNGLISKKQMRQFLGWSFTTYNSMQACSLADELKFLGFQYASQSGISISIEDLIFPFVKNRTIETANQDITNSEKLYLKGKITNVERFQKIIDTWSLTSESLKDQIVYYFKHYDPLNSVYIMAFSGARGNLSQVRQLVGMRGLMSDPSGEIMNLPIKKNFREGLTITDYLMSGYGARKGIVDTALKTANSGYLTRRLIDVSQDILIREKDCLTDRSIFFSVSGREGTLKKLLGCILNKGISDHIDQSLIAKSGSQITEEGIQMFKKKKIKNLYIRTPLTCKLYRAICQRCYGWDLASENLIDIGEAIGILAGQSIGEPGTQLTMRTFHTGGIFTAGTREQIISPTNGIIQFYKQLKTHLLRTNRGEDVLVTRTSGFVLLIPDNKGSELIQIQILANTILFPKNNQYVSRDTVIGEIINTNRQLKTEKKAILTDESGEVFIPKLKKPVNLANNNHLIWILFGKLFYSPPKAFLNFYPDYKINQKSSIFRAKFINHHNGNIITFNRKTSLYQRSVRTSTLRYCFTNAQIKKLACTYNLKTHILEVPNAKYLISVSPDNSHNYLKHTSNNQVGYLITNKFQTKVGGTLFYENPNLFTQGWYEDSIIYFKYPWDLYQYTCPISYGTVFWLSEEIHEIKCEPNELLVDQGDVISAGVELIQDRFSKTGGLINFTQNAGLIRTISIKSGLVYEGPTGKSSIKKLYYPGERIFSNISMSSLAVCEFVSGKKANQLLLRPLKVYEVPRVVDPHIKMQNSRNIPSILTLKSKPFSAYKSGQKIKTRKNRSLILSLLLISLNMPNRNNLNIELVNSINNKNKVLLLRILEKLELNNYIVPSLKYKKLNSCLISQEGQFLSQYMIVGYVEGLTDFSLEIVKIKVKNLDSKQIMLISNKNCLTISKQSILGKGLNDLVTVRTQTGKILLENEKTFTIQKGQPYFFPNCKDDTVTFKSQLEYKVLPGKYFTPSNDISQKIAIQFFDITKFSSKNPFFKDPVTGFKFSATIEFSKFFFKRKGKLYSCLVPPFLKNLQVNDNLSKFKFEKFIDSNRLCDFSSEETDEELETPDEELEEPKWKTIAIKTSGMARNWANESISSRYSLSFLKFGEQPFEESTKAIGLYSITEDLFEQDVNSIFCKNKEFIEAGRTIGFLNLEKEITGDIVQGLPRIEEILEARKKNLIFKNIPTNQKKGLLTQVTSLDPSFEFKKLGLPILENDKINPHKLLKVYFSYYGISKKVFCVKEKKILVSRLTNNYEGSYKSFQKIQRFILQSVQAVYRAQGVDIHNKHLEVIIKQMTTKVLITYEGDAPLLRKEVIDLYHILYINKTVKSQRKEQASYVPLVLGVTKAALNNPSFLSAASFQETTRVLTKAAIEGRIDWLRGLKENIIVGHLIPAGTGSPNYQIGFREDKKCCNLEESKITLS